MTTTTTTTVDDNDERMVADAAWEMAEEQLQTLTASHAATFVGTERRSTAFQQHLQSQLLDVDIPHCLQQTEIATQIMQNGIESWPELTERHRVRRRTLLGQSSSSSSTSSNTAGLLELLELPNLMDAAVRSSSFYEQALQIAAFANTLQRRHQQHTTTTTSSSSNTVIQTVIDQIRARQVDLRRHLLQVLQDPGTVIQDCLQVVTALRRLDAIDLEYYYYYHNQQQCGDNNNNNNKAGGGGSDALEQAHAAMEYALQLDFLEARDVSLHTTTTTNKNDESLLDSIERYRTRLFEIVTQFHAIFLRSSTSSTSNNNNNNNKLLALWTTRRVETFLTLLREQLLNAPPPPTQAATTTTTTIIDAAACRDALEASVFFGHSMGRLGVDFTAQLSNIFETKMYNIVTAFWIIDGVTKFRETITICREAGVAAPLASTSQVVGGATVAATTDDDTTTTAAMDAGSSTSTNNASSSLLLLGGPQAPPKILLTLPPLARLVNAVLTGLNELRRCLLPGIFQRLREALEGQVLLEVASELASNQRAVNVPGFLASSQGSSSPQVAITATTNLRRIAADMIAMWQTVCEPYLRGSLEAAIGNTVTAAQYHQILLDNLHQKAQQQQQQQQAETKETQEKLTTSEEAEDEQSTVDAQGADDAEDLVEEEQHDGEENLGRHNEGEEDASADEKDD